MVWKILSVLTPILVAEVFLRRVQRRRIHTEIGEIVSSLKSGDIEDPVKLVLKMYDTVAAAYNTSFAMLVAAIVAISTNPAVSVLLPVGRLSSDSFTYGGIGLALGIICIMAA